VSRPAQTEKAGPVDVKQKQVAFQGKKKRGEANKRIGGIRREKWLSNVESRGNVPFEKRGFEKERGGGVRIRKGRRGGGKKGVVFVGSAHVQFGNATGNQIKKNDERV